jgi:hypothetical protein
MRTNASKPVDKVVTSAAVSTRRRRAVVNVDAAVLANEARRALAPEVVDKVDARGALGARVVGAVVNVGLAQGADEPDWAEAGAVRAGARAPVHARRRLRAGRHVAFATFSFVVRLALALEPVAFVSTRPSFTNNKNKDTN